MAATKEVRYMNEVLPICRQEIVRDQDLPPGVSLGSLLTRWYQALPPFPVLRRQLPRMPRGPPTPSLNHLRNRGGHHIFRFILLQTCQPSARAPLLPSDVPYFGGIVVHVHPPVHGTTSLQGFLPLVDWRARTHQHCRSLKSWPKQTHTRIASLAPSKREALTREYDTL